MQSNCYIDYNRQNFSNSIWRFNVIEIQRKAKDQISLALLLCLVSKSMQNDQFVMFLTDFPKKFPFFVSFSQLVNSTFAQLWIRATTFKTYC